MLAELQHPHLLPLLGYSLDAATPCLVYPLMPGGNLEDRLRPTEPRAASRLASLGLQLCPQLGLLAREPRLLLRTPIRRHPLTDLRLLLVPARRLGLHLGLELNSAAGPRPRRGTRRYRPARRRSAALPVVSSASEPSAPDEPSEPADV